MRLEELSREWIKSMAFPISLENWIKKKTKTFSRKILIEIWWKFLIFLIQFVIPNNSCEINIFWLFHSFKKILNINCIMFWCSILAKKRVIMFEDSLLSAQIEILMLL